MAMTLQDAIGEKVKAARARKGLTQEQLASEIDRTTEAISNIERGVSLASIETLERLSRALEVPLKEFFDDAGYFRQISRRRFNLEAELRELGRGLDDRDLALAVALVRVVASKR
jgi:transcriptional regulator with XRE-family HTH domain